MQHPGQTMGCITHDKYIYLCLLINSIYFNEMWNWGCWKNAIKGSELSYCKSTDDLVETNGVVCIRNNWTKSDYNRTVSYSSIQPIPWNKQMKVSM